MKRYKHSLSHYKLLSCNMGKLVPVGLLEVLPGDTFQQATSLLLRCSPLLAPVMHPVHVRVHHWFVPTRLIWDEFEDFITGGPDGMDATIPPTIDFTSSAVAEGSLADYLGLPTGYAGVVSALPFRAYNFIWNEAYRDQDLQSELAFSTASGADSTTTTVLQNVCWEKDYFTKARPWASKGPEVTIPMASSAPVESDGQQPFVTVSGSGVDRNLFAGASNHVDYTGAVPGGNPALIFGTQTGFQTDLSDARATINELREAFAIMRYQEARARYGSRYVEYLRYLGVRSSDARLQRPEYLGGGKQTIQFSEVLQTGVSVDSSDAPIGEVGDLKGHGIAAMRSNRYRRFFEEHGFVISFLSVRPKTMYTQGINRMWFRQTKEDYFQKELQHIGQQEIYNRELYALSFPGSVFGYGDRYGEYREVPSTVSGQFRSTLDFWHMAREFSSLPTLNSDFVKSSPTDRVFAVPTEDTLWIMANHSIQARRFVSNSTGSHVY